MPIKSPQPFTLPRADFIAAREELGLTQKVLAERLGLQRRQILRYESGESEVPTVVAFSVRYLLAQAT